MIRKLLITFALISASNLYAQTTKVRLVTSQFAPLQYKQDSPQGYVVDLLNRLRPLLKQKHQIELGPIEFFPWRRAIQIASNDENTLFFSLSRTVQREDNFKWLAEVSPYSQAIFSLSNEDTFFGPETLTNWQALAESKKILAVQSGSQLETFVANELLMKDDQLYPVSHYLTAIKMLFAGRIDYIPLTAFLANGTLCRSGFPSDRLKLNFAIDEFAKPLWIAFSNSTHEGLVEITKQEVLALTQSNWYKNHQKQTIDEWNLMQCKQFAKQ